MGTAIIDTSEEDMARTVALLAERGITLPLKREDIPAVCEVINEQLEMINGHLDAAIARCALRKAVEELQA